MERDRRIIFFRTIRNYSKGGVGGIEAVKILALPKRGGGSDPCQDFFGGFVEVSQKPYSGILKLKMT